jgi:hypothetical protein
VIVHDWLLPGVVEKHVPLALTVQAPVGVDDTSVKTDVFSYARCVPLVTQLPLYTLGSVPLNNQQSPVHVGVLFEPLHPLISKTLHVGDPLHSAMHCANDSVPELTAVDAMPCV